MEYSKLGFPVLYHLPEFAQTHVLGVTIQPSRTLSSPSPPAFTLSPNQSFFQWVGSLYQVNQSIAILRSLEIVLKAVGSH